MKTTKNEKLYRVETESKRYFGHWMAKTPADACRIAQSNYEQTNFVFLREKLVAVADKGKAHNPWRT